MKVFAFLVAFFAFEAVAQSTNFKSATGTVVNRSQRFETYVNSSSAALTVGQAVCPDITDDDGIGVDLCAASGDMALGLVTDTSCAVGARCKVIVKGYFASAAFSPSEGNAVAGGSAFAHTNGKVYGDTTDENKHPVGIFLDAASATGAVEIFVNP